MHKASPEEVEVVSIVAILVVSNLKNRSREVLVTNTKSAPSPEGVQIP